MLFGRSVSLRRLHEPRHLASSAKAFFAQLAEVHSMGMERLADDPGARWALRLGFHHGHSDLPLSVCLFQQVVQSPLQFSEHRRRDCFRPPFFQGPKFLALVLSVRAKAFFRSRRKSLAIVWRDWPFAFQLLAKLTSLGVKWCHPLAVARSERSSAITTACDVMFRLSGNSDKQD